jgi:hypothetical protein
MKNTWQTICMIALITVATLSLSGCDTLSNEPTPAHIHQWGGWAVTTAPNCSRAGEKTRVCSLDSSHKETEYIPVDLNNHDWDYLGTAPTCTETGSGTRICKLCRKSETLEVIPALGHQWGNWTVTTPATCATTGTETRTCAHDVGHQENRTLAVNPNNHDWNYLGTAPTCTETGS